MQQKDKDGEYETQSSEKSKAGHRGISEGGNRKNGRESVFREINWLNISRTETPILRPEKLKAQTGHMTLDPLPDTL